MKFKIAVIYQGVLYSCFLGVVCLMLLLAEVTGETEIIFPELAAIGLGIFLSPKRSWATNKKRMLILLSLAAVIGILIVRFVPGPQWGQMLLAYAVSQLMLLYSRTTFAPFISAIVLPVMLGSDSIVYVISAIGLTAFVLGITWILEQFKIWDKEPFVQRQKATPMEYLKALVRIIIIGISIYLAFRIDIQYAVAPPVLVAFTEFMRPGGQPPQKPVRVCVFVVLCSMLGVICRMAFDVNFVHSLILAGAFAAVGVLFLVRWFKLYIPPAAALAILPMLIDVNKLIWYPLQVAIGMSILTGIAFWINGKRLEGKG
ncbi:MAG: hypothetical protein K6G01_08955 [Eubacterium sp.]|nr:hypothetical protein [Eubacterium sp.]